MNDYWLFLFILLKVINLKTYYIDSTSGRDSLSGLSSQSAWKTVLFFNSSDTLLFKSGTVYKHGITIKDLDNVMIGRYGDKKKMDPCFDYSVRVEGDQWVDEGDEVYSVVVEKRVEHVFVNNQRYNLSHYPYNGIDGLKNYLYYPNAPIKQADGKLIVPLPDEFLSLTYEQVINSTFITKIYSFYFHAAKVIEYNISAKTITVDEAKTSHYTANNGFILTGKVWMINNGTWAYSDNKLYIKMKNGAHPKDEDIYYNHEDSPINGITIENSHNVTISNLIIQNTKECGIKVDPSSCNIMISGNTIYNSGSKGINIFGKDNKVIGNNVTFSVLQGITAFDYANKIYHLEVYNNHIENTFVYGPLELYYYGNDLGHIGGIVILSDVSDDSQWGSKIRYNTIVNSGYNGITACGKNNYIEFNYVKRVCLVLADCASLYWYTTHGNVARYNLLVDSIGDYHGTNAYPQKTSGGTAGIYLDGALSGNGTVTNNVVINSRVGITISSRNDLIMENVFFNTSYAASIREMNITKFQKYYLGSKELRKFTNYSRNIFHSIDDISYYSVYISPYAFNEDHPLYYYEMEKHFNDNIFFPNMMYVRMPYENERYYIFPINPGKNPNTELEMYYDKNGRKLGGNDYVINEFSYVKYSNLSDNLITNGNFNQSIVTYQWCSGYNLSWGDNKFARVYTEDFESHPVEVLRNNYAKFEILKDMEYVVKFDASYIDPLNHTSQNYLTITIKMGSQPYSVIGEMYNERVIITSEMKTYECYFKGLMNFSSRLYFFSNIIPNTYYHFDNIELYEVNITHRFHDIRDDFDILYNPSVEKSKTINTQELKYCDENGVLIDKKSITLSPLSAQVIVKCMCNNDGECNNFENANTCPNDCEPICGNKVCESGENFDNCPSDCSKDDNDYTILIIILSIVSFSILVSVVILIIVIIITLSRKNSLTNEVPLLSVKSEQEVTLSKSGMDEDIRL